MNTQTYKWSDGFEITMDYFHRAEGYKNLGYANEWSVERNREIRAGLKGKGYEIKVANCNHVYVYPESKVIFGIDSSD